jgi:hypothetical protein
VVHYRNLQLYTERGLKITKIHRILGFQQRPWWKTYIDFNADKRKQAKNYFEKDCFQTNVQQVVTVYLFRIINVPTGTNGIIIKVLWIKYYVIFIPCHAPQNTTQKTKN